MKRHRLLVLISILTVLTSCHREEGLRTATEQSKPDERITTGDDSNSSPSAATREGNEAAVLDLPRVVENSIGMKLVLISPGEFLMGSPDSDADAKDDEKPQHLVRITKPFYMAAYEVTQRQYKTVMNANPSIFSPTGVFPDRVVGLDSDRLPVDSVTWSSAKEFCTSLSDLTAEKNAKRTYRLPTEAEWEYACRAGTTTRFHFGETITGQDAEFDDAPSDQPFARSRLTTTPVGSFNPNGFGLYDMHGNVAEWCEDYMDFDFYNKGIRDNPVNRTPNQLNNRVFRGGGRSVGHQLLRAARRESSHVAARTNMTGIRVVLEVDAF